MIEEFSEFIQTAIVAFVFFGLIMWFSCYMTSLMIFTVYAWQI